MKLQVSYIYIIFLNAAFIFCLIYVHFMSLRHVSAVLGRHQVCVSPTKIVSIYAPFCVTDLYLLLITGIICRNN
jgi:hypothetical protein